MIEQWTPQTEWSPLKVCYWEFYRFKVASETMKNRWYLADVCENKGFGKCDCTSYRARIGIKHHELEIGVITKMDLPKDWSWDCKHLTAAFAAIGKRDVEIWLQSNRQQS